MNIRFNSLRVRNGLVWRRLKLDLADAGLTLLIGDNGSGKTSIPDLLACAFYDETLKHGKGTKAVLNWHTPKGEGLTIEVQYDREEKPGKWVSYRLLKHYGVKGQRNGAKLYRKGRKEALTAARDSRAAQRYVSEHIGMTFAEFIASVYLPHRAVHPLVTGTPSSRAKYITDVYKLDEYDAKHAAAKVALAEVKDELEDYEDNAERLRVLTADLKVMPKESALRRTIEALTGDIEDLQEERAKVDTLHLRAVRKRDRQARRKKLERRRESATKATRSAESIKLSLRKMRKRREAVSDTLPELRRRKVILKEIAAITLPKKAPSEKEQEQRRASMKTLRKQIAAFEDRIETLEALEGLADCPTCGQRLKGTKVDPTKLSSLRDKLESAEKSLERHREGHAAYEEYLDAKEEIEGLRNELKDLPEGDYGKLRAKANELDGTIEEAERLLEKLVQKEALDQEIAELPRGNPDKTQRTVEKHAKAKTRIQRKIDSKREARAAVKEQLRSRRATIEEVKQLRQTDKASKKLTRRAEVLTDLVFAFSNKGMKLDRMTEILSEIERRLPTYTGALLPRYEFKLAEKDSAIQFDVVMGDVSSPVSALSEGEKKRLSLALVRVEKDMRTVQTNLLFLDEFDGGIDEPGRDMLLDILIDLKTVYPSIFAISHHQTVMGHSAFDSRLRVVRGERFSKLANMGR